MPPKELQKITDYIWELPKTYKEGMRVPARLFASEPLIKEFDDGVFDQISNVAMLPGIVKHAMCMPDGHWGYGFPIGGVAAFDPKEGGIISPGGVGFDVNCGMRLLTTNLTEDDVKPKLKELVDTLYATVPAGVGGKGFIELGRDEFKHVVEAGVPWCLEKGYGWSEDLKRIEESGRLKSADSSAISEKSISRGMKQVGTLGSGNHYLEIQVVREENIFDPEAAKAMGITGPGQITVMIHTGSRGFGHQVATDYIKEFVESAMPKHGITVADRELACAPFESDEGQRYFQAMSCAVNMAFCNRQVIMHRVREGFAKVFGKTAEEMEMNLVYDVCHNIAKLEKHTVDGKKKNLVVHRKGATRSFGPGQPDVPEIYKDIGQPVICGGSMETGSYLLKGTQGAMDQTFGSTMHGSGRAMSRAKAKKQFRGDKLQKDMEGHGIYVRSVSMSGLAEEAGKAYKDIDEVVETVHNADISKRVVALKPIGNVKG